MKFHAVRQRINLVLRMNDQKNQTKRIKLLLLLWLLLLSILLLLRTVVKERANTTKSSEPSSLICLMSLVQKVIVSFPRSKTRTESLLGVLEFPNKIASSMFSSGERKHQGCSMATSTPTAALFPSVCGRCVPVCSESTETQIITENTAQRAILLGVHSSLSFCVLSQLGNAHSVRMLLPRTHTALLHIARD